MKGLKISAGAKKALIIGALCSISYLAVYIARNTLSAVSAQMTAGIIVALPYRKLKKEQDIATQ